MAKLFFSYAHEDEALRDKLETHLSLLKRQGVIETWPFTHGLGSVRIPKGTTTVRIEAHDKVHGWSRNPLQVDLSKAGDGRLRVEADRQEASPLKRKR